MLSFSIYWNIIFKLFIYWGYIFFRWLRFTWIWSSSYKRLSSYFRNIIFLLSSWSYYGNYWWFYVFFDWSKNRFWVSRMKNLSPLNKRRLSNFVKNKRGLYSFWIFLVLFLISLFADFIANEKPLLIKYENEFYYPILQAYSETLTANSVKYIFAFRAWKNIQKGPPIYFRGG